MKKSLKLALLLPVLLLVVGCSGGNSEADDAKAMKGTQSASSITIYNNDYDFGDIPINGGKVSVEFPFKNSGQDSIVISEGITTCMCTEAVVESNDGIVSPTLKMPAHGNAIAQVNQVLESGESAKLTATFDPMAHGPGGVGPITREVILKTNSTVLPEVKFKFKGNVVQ
ncbi:MAG: DUF1573 domain-containing protein [Candidatus Peregrinibacteria bacterium]|nr:DUF1573 domain-containing protein [Candidatus Peregrinibacteria bacterium]MDZ4244933.1 DUF1573 domain-containing protein [Candidatus Gracilibacteria bacterium]